MVTSSSHELESQTAFCFCLHREVFMDFDPVAISELTNKKITSPDSLLSEQKLRSILENANQVRKVT